MEQMLSTPKSDVWGFGVVLWEMYNPERKPYWNWDNQTVIVAVLEGKRMGQPDGCADEMYGLMMQCWRDDPAERPTFVEAIAALEAMDFGDIEESEESDDDGGAAAPPPAAGVYQ